MIRMVELLVALQIPTPTRDGLASVETRRRAKGGALTRTEAAAMGCRCRESGALALRRQNRGGTRCSSARRSDTKAAQRVGQTNCGSAA